MRFTRARSLEELRVMGYEPCTLEAGVMFRTYGVPLRQIGALPIEGTTAKCFVPRWAARLINEWPLGSMDSSGDFDHVLLKIVIARTVRTGDEDFARAACAVAMLDGERGVNAFLGR